MSTEINIDNIIIELKEKDSYYSILYKRMSYIYGIFAIVFLFFLALRPYSDITLGERIGGICAFGAMTIFFFLFKHEHNKFSRLDYSLSILELLKNARERHRLGGTKWIYLTAAVLLMDISVTKPFFPDIPGRSSQLFSFVFTDHILYLSAIGISFLIGILVWVVKYKPLLKNIDSMIHDLTIN